MKYKNLETLRKAKGYTVEELIRNVSVLNGSDVNDDSRLRNKYYRWQDGANIAVADMIALHQIFGVSVDCILDVKPLEISG